MLKRLGSSSRRLLICTALALAGVASGSGSARADWLDCNVREIAEFGGRLHVRCWNSITLSGNVVFYLSIGKGDAGLATRFHSVASAAQLSNRLLRFELPASGASNVAGCGATNCRTPSAWLLID